MAEIVIPIIVDDKSYHNVVVPLKVLYKTTDDLNFKRELEIVRIQDEEVTWPPHPRNTWDKIIGAIAIVHSLDDYYLIVKNGSLWGLPKGARNYYEYMRLKAETEAFYKEWGFSPSYTGIEFTECETAIENIVREIREETGIIITDRSSIVNMGIADSSYCAYDRFVYNWPFLAKEYTSLVTQDSIDHENDEICWIHVDDLMEMMSKHQSTKLFNHISYMFLVDYFELIYGDTLTL